jgi:hypothetical protein
MSSGTSFTGRHFASLRWMAIWAPCKEGDPEAAEGGALTRLSARVEKVINKTRELAHQAKSDFRKEDGKDRKDSGIDLGQLLRASDPSMPMEDQLAGGTKAAAPGLPKMGCMHGDNSGRCHAHSVWMRYWSCCLMGPWTH